MKKALIPALFVAFLLTTTGYSQNFTVTQGLTPTQLIQNGLLGAGVTISNVSGQVTSQSAGTFVNSGVIGFPFQNGLVLSTGSVNDLENAPSTFLSTDLALTGDATLDAIVSPAQTYDAQVLSFDFSAASDSVEFEFIFSSEEYNEYVNSSFNDVFGFFISGPGYAPNTNVALIPGTATPISINNVNNGNAFGPATGPCTNCSYYTDNQIVPTPVGLAPDGFTVPIKLKFAVWPCTSYSFKIAIADVADGVFDSQVFLKQGSFVACPNVQPLVNNAPAPAVVYLCQGESLTLTAPVGPSYIWNTGENTQSITVTQAGIYSVAYAQSSCVTTSDAVQVIMVPALTQPVLSLLNDTLYSNTSDPNLTYNWSLNGVAISTSQPSIPSPIPGCYQLQITNSNGCSALSDSLCITPTGLPDYFEQHTSIYPNPANNFITIEIPVNDNSISEVTIYDICGNIVIPVQSITGNKGDVDVSVLPLGIYTVEIFSTPGGNRKYLMLVKN